MTCLINTIDSEILENYSNPVFDVSSLSKKIDKSPSFLREVTYKNLGIGTQYLIETIRLKNAIKCLSNNNEPIDIICLKSGYSYSKTFRSAFKKRIKMTPLECKKLIHNSKDIDLVMKKIIETLYENFRKQPLISTGENNLRFWVLRMIFLYFRFSL